jgi:hypothetical protein
MYALSSRFAVVAAVLALALSSAGAAAAHGGREVVKSGGCSGTATWKLKAKADGGRIEVEGEVDANHVGQVWHWRILHDGNVSYRGVKTTSGPSGSFSVTRRVVNMSGTDSIGFRAVNRATGQTCRGHLAF